MPHLLALLQLLPLGPLAGTNTLLDLVATVALSSPNLVEPCLLLSGLVDLPSMIGLTPPWLPQQLLSATEEWMLLVK